MIEMRWYIRREKKMVGSAAPGGQRLCGGRMREVTHSEKILQYRDTVCGQGEWKNVPVEMSRTITPLPKKREGSSIR